MADIIVTFPNGAPTATLPAGYHAIEMNRELERGEKVVVRSTTDRVFDVFTKPDTTLPKQDAFSNQVDNMRRAVYITGDTDTVFEGRGLKSDITVTVNAL